MDDKSFVEAVDKFRNSDNICQWTRAFDQHFNISCVGETGERANGNFKGKDQGAKWEFKFCPYCGKEIYLTNHKETT